MNLEQQVRFDSDGSKFKLLNPVEASFSSSPDGTQSNLSRLSDVAKL